MAALDPDIQRPFLGIHAINVFVRDQDASLSFYIEKLGFNVAFDSRLPDGTRWVAVAPPDGSAVLSLVAAAPESREAKLIGRHTGIVLVTENVLAKFEEWRRHGVEFVFTPRLRRFQLDPHKSNGGEAPVWGGIFTRFKDLDGNSFNLVGFDEINREIEARRRRIAEKLEAERRSAHELEIARQVQARLFPQSLPELDTLAYAGACIQARQVGGDYHDFLDLGPGRFGLVIADISGKGMPAALLMANLQAAFRSQSAIAAQEPERMLRSVNQLFYRNTGESSYATLFFAEYDDRSRRLRYANCGHLPPLILRRDGAVDRLDSTCTVLGLFEQWHCPVSETCLCAGDTLVLYTDGVTEAFNAAEEEFGEARLLDCVHRHQDAVPRCAIDAVVGELQQFSPHEQFDDITLIVARST